MTKATLGGARKYLVKHGDIDVKKHKELVKQLVTEAVKDLAGKKTRGTKRAASSLASSLSKRMVPKLYEDRANFTIYSDDSDRTCYVMS